MCKRTAITNMSEVSDKLSNGYSALVNTYKNAASGLYSHTLLLLKQLHVLWYIEPIFHVYIRASWHKESYAKDAENHKERYNLTDRTRASRCIIHILLARYVFLCAAALFCLFHHSVHMNKYDLSKVLTVWAMIVLNFGVGMFWKQPKANILLVLLIYAPVLQKYFFGCLSAAVG